MPYITETELSNLYGEIDRKEAENARLRDALTKWIEWEAKMLNAAGVWNENDGLPHFTQEVHDEYIALQLVRNDAMEQE